LCSNVLHKSPGAGVLRIEVPVTALRALAKVARRS
jgi:hypothetical protein